jgi:hypothetical protein
MLKHAISASYTLMKPIHTNYWKARKSAEKAINSEDMPILNMWLRLCWLRASTSLYEIFVAWAGLYRKYVMGEDKCHKVKENLHWRP